MSVARKPMGFQSHFVTLIVSWAGLKVLLVLPNIFVRIKIVLSSKGFGEFTKVILKFGVEIILVSRAYS